MGVTPPCSHGPFTDSTAQHSYVTNLSREEVGPIEVQFASFVEEHELSHVRSYSTAAGERHRLT